MTDIIDRLAGPPSVLAMRDAADELGRYAYKLGAAEQTIRRLRDMLAHLRKHPGECLGDNPRWVAEIDRLLTETEPTH
jgi:hypothetical protein